MLQGQGCRSVVGLGQKVACTPNPVERKSPLSFIFRFLLLCALPLIPSPSKGFPYLTSPSHNERSGKPWYFDREKLNWLQDGHWTDTSSVPPASGLHHCWDLVATFLRTERAFSHFTALTFGLMSWRHYASHRTSRNIERCSIRRLDAFAVRFFFVADWLCIPPTKQPALSEETSNSTECFIPSANDVSTIEVSVRRVNGGPDPFRNLSGARIRVCKDPQTPLPILYGG